MAPRFISGHNKRFDVADLAESWSVLRQEVDSRSVRLATGIADAWGQVQALTQALSERLLAQDPAETWPATVVSLESLFKGLAGQLLFEPLALYRKTRPMFSVVSAIQEYESGLIGVVQRLPAVCKISGRELLELPGAERGAGWKKHWLRWQRTARDVPFRAIVSGHLQRQILRRRALDGGLQLILARSCLHLLGPWQICREHALRTLSGKRGAASIELDRRQWVEETGKHAQKAAVLLDGYNRWATVAADSLTSAVIRSPAEPSANARRHRSEKLDRCLSYWSRQQRAVLSTIELESSLGELAAELTKEGAASLESIQCDHEQLLKELDGVIKCLDAWSRGEDAGSFPPPQVRVISAEQYTRDWGQRVLASARYRLPSTVETVEPRRSLPVGRSPWRDLEPQKLFSRALDSLGVPALTTGLREVVVAHHLVMREIERAREVVAFGEETARAEGLAGQAVAREAVENALSLLLYQKERTPEVRPLTEASLVRAQALVLLDCQVALEKGRVGLLTHLTRQRGLRAIARARELSIAGLRLASRKAWQFIHCLFEQVLIKVGWLAPPRPRLEPVGRRAHLGQVLDLQLHSRELPMIYRRLFRLTPIEEHRFLVGRETEMAGLAEVLAEWKSGRRGSALVVGARGSGKTSLLNCAVSGLFAGMAVVRGQFSARVTTREQMLEMLQQILRLPEGSDLTRTLAADRRVVIVEELERSFLRVINGFEALRELLSLTYETSAGTLWILSINETAFRYLNAVVGLGRHFSHRINAMSVMREDLVGAILQRHELSGLRLEFAPLPEEDPRLGRVRRLFGLEQDPEQLFFESLYRQSEGIFRSAFELWQGSIERVEGGIVHMRQPLVPDYRPLRSELDHRDHFILQAILQHGGLTAEEVAQVCRLDIENSWRRLGRLRILEILEPEPDYPGYRVRPEAGLFVREALHSQNLW